MRAATAGCRTEPGANPGLLFERYIPKDAIRGEPRAEFLLRIADLQPDRSYFEAAERYRAEIGKLPGAVRQYTAMTKSPIALGLGGRHPFENGFALRRPYGVPYIPGSGLRGAMRRVAADALGIRAAMSAVYTPDMEIKRLLAEVERQGASVSRDRVEAFYSMFGGPEESGAWTVLDGWLVRPPGRRVDVKPFMLDTITVHHPLYYQGKPDPPTDADEPSPVSLLAVRPGILFHFAIQSPDEAWAGQAERLLAEVLVRRGVGAKTNAGYGRFEPPTRV